MPTESLHLTGDPDNIRVSASDVAAHGGCPRRLAVKIRPDVKSSTWRRSYGGEDTFVLGLVLDLVASAHGENLDGPGELTEWIRARLELRRVHPLLRPYALTAVTEILEAHQDIEDEIGELKLITNTPQIGRVPRRLWVWAPLYATADGIREIRRFRLGSAHTKLEPDDLLWVQTAARVAGTVPGHARPTRVRVVEIGAADGSINVVFDDTAEAAVASFEQQAKAISAGLGNFDVPIPGPECSDCKVAGVCDALIPVNEVLGQSGPGYATRSISPSGLDRYRQCPAQWLYVSDLHLPRDTEGSEAQTRGILVHEWLEHAHVRRIGCTPEDLPEPGIGRGLAAEIMSESEYAIAYPFLRHHVATCPLGADGVEVVEVESNVFGFDAIADLVAVTKPDLVLRIGDRLVVREFKTAFSLPAGGEQEAYSKFFQVPFLASMLMSGMAAAYGAEAATVELELLTPDAGAVHAWDTDDPGFASQVRTDIKAAVDDWHIDSTWNTRPGAHCVSCPVRRWCPDRDAYAEVAKPAPVPEDDDPPPF